MVVLFCADQGGGVLYLGCLCVSPDYQGHGIGTRAFAYLPTLFPDWQRIELVTPADKTENIRFYTHRYGCTVNGTEQDGHVEVVRLVRKRAEV